MIKSKVQDLTEISRGWFYFYLRRDDDDDGGDSDLWRSSEIFSSLQEVLPSLTRKLKGNKNATQTRSNRNLVTKIVVLNIS